jgi:hypothetical protein
MALKELYNLYINNKYVKSVYIDIPPDEYRSREPPIQIGDLEGMVKYILAEEDDILGELT